MKTAILGFAIIIIVLALILMIILYPRIHQEFRKKKNYLNTYAIQNVESGKNIRVYNANIEDDAQIILYRDSNWECMTWQFIQLHDNIYLLKNLYTQKTFQPTSSPKEGINLWQKTLGGSSLQYWEFIKQSDETYLIRLQDTELYLTTTSHANNSEIILMPKQNSAK